MPEEPGMLPPKKKQLKEPVKVQKEEALKRKLSPRNSKPKQTKRPTKQKESKSVPTKAKAAEPPKPKLKPGPKPRTKPKPKLRKPSPVPSPNETAGRTNKKRPFEDDSRPRKIMKPNSDEESSEEFEPDPHKWFGPCIYKDQDKLMYGSLVLHDNPGKCTSIGDTIQIRWKQQPHLEFGDIDSIWEIKSNKGKKFSISRAYIKASNASAKGKFGRNELFQIQMKPEFRQIWCRYMIRSTLVWFPPETIVLTDIESETSGREHFFCRYVYDSETHELTPILENIRTKEPPWQREWTERASRRL